MRRNSSAKREDFSFRVGPETVTIAREDRFWSALQTTKHGYAWMEAECGPVGTEGSLRIWFVWHGRGYMRVYERFYGRRWAARLAGEFAREVIEGKVK